MMHLPGTSKSNAVMYTFYDVLRPYQFQLHDTLNCLKHHVLHNLNFRILRTNIHVHKLSKHVIHSIL